MKHQPPQMVLTTVALFAGLFAALVLHFEGVHFLFRLPDRSG